MSSNFQRIFTFENAHKFFFNFKTKLHSSYIFKTRALNIVLDAEKLDFSVSPKKKTFSKTLKTLFLFVMFMYALINA